MVFLETIHEVHALNVVAEWRPLFLTSLLGFEHRVTPTVLSIALIAKNLFTEALSTSSESFPLQLRNSTISLKSLFINHSMTKSKRSRDETETYESDDGFVENDDGNAPKSKKSKKAGDSKPRSGGDDQFWSASISSLS